VFLDHWFMMPAMGLCAGIVGLAPLGKQVLRRGVVFIDLAVAQAAASAAIWAKFLYHGESIVLDQLAATTGALIVSMTIQALARKWREQREALIGLIYVAAACSALLGASQNPHGRDKVLELLAADVLWVDSTRVALLAGFSMLSVILSRIDKFANDTVFYIMFAIMASIAVPALGLFLVFASLIAPALWIVRGMSDWRAIIVASIACCLGLLGSWLMDTPSGPSIVIAISLYGFAAIFYRQRP
jgi:zinc/manganese transport system permease protein